MSRSSLSKSIYGPMARAPLDQLRPLVFHVANGGPDLVGIHGWKGAPHQLDRLVPVSFEAGESGRMLHKFAEAGAGSLLASYTTARALGFLYHGLHLSVGGSGRAGLVEGGKGHPGGSEHPSGNSCQPFVGWVAHSTSLLTDSNSPGPEVLNRLWMF